MLDTNLHRIGQASQWQDSGKILNTISPREPWQYRTSIMKIIIYKNSHGLSDFIKVLCLILVSTMDQGEVQYVIVWYNTIPIPSQQTEATKSDPFVGRLPEGYFFCDIVRLWLCSLV